MSAHTEYHATLDKIELGLEAFEQLLAFTKGMSKVIENYDVFEDVEESYTEEGHKIVKDFIRVGFDFIRSHPDAKKLESNMKAVEVVPLTDEAPPVLDCPTEPGGVPVHIVDLNQADEGMLQEATFHLSQVDHQFSLNTLQQTPVNKASVKTEEEVTEVEYTREKKKNSKKHKRQKRLLKFHEKLVTTHGLPPSRLMVGKNLESEFEQIAGVQAEPASNTNHDHDTPSAHVLPVLMPGQQGVQLLQQSPAVHVAGYSVPPASVPGLVLGEPFKPGSSTPLTSVIGDACHVPMPGYSHTLGQGTESTSGPDITSSLCSSPQFLGRPMSVGWSEARPVPGYGWDQPAVWNGTLPQPSFGLSSRSTSGYLKLSSLSPSLQFSNGWNTEVPTQQQQPLPVSPGSPAYCFHCLQYGTVFTINLV